MACKVVLDSALVLLQMPSPTLTTPDRVLLKLVLPVSRVDMPTVALAPSMAATLIRSVSLVLVSEVSVWMTTDATALLDMVRLARVQFRLGFPLPSSFDTISAQLLFFLLLSVT
jgi:hypothetical protein